MRILSHRLVLLRCLGSGGAPAAFLAAFLVLSACVPAGIALTLGALVNRLQDPGVSFLFRSVLVPLVAFGLVIFIGHLADAAAKPLEFAVRARIDGAHRSRILALTTGVSSIGPLERPDVQRLIRQTGAEPDYGVTTPADGANAQLRWFAGLVGAAAACGVVSRYAWWLVPLLLVPAAVGLYLRSRQYFAAIRALQYAMKEELHADVWRNAASSSAEGKDVRMFGFAEWMVSRMQKHIYAGNAPFWTHVVKVAQRSWIQFSLALVGLVPAYVLVTRDAAVGDTSVGVQASVLVAGWSVFGAIGASDGAYKMVGSVHVLRAFDLLRSIVEPLTADPAEAATALGRPAVESQDPPLVQFSGVRFSYPGTAAVVLDDLDLDIRPGELLAIVGLNGAGKSTLIKLLTGLYPSDAGRITADGVDIASIGLDAWRRRISVVFQDFVRYQLSALDNVTFGQASAPGDRVAADAAALEAGFDEVLRRLPAGWDSPLSRARTGGVDLSGGQWQQVVLARALYAVRKGARLLVLDEPTAHLDVRTEFEVFRQLVERRGNTSLVLISHRLSTVRQADRIVLLAGGRITESGTHDELMALGGTYAKLFTVQAERFQLSRDVPVDEEIPL